MPFVVTPYGFMIPFGGWVMLEHHCANKRKNIKKHKVADGRNHPFVFSLFFPIMGACCAQIKDFTLGCRELVLVRPNVKPFI